MQLKTLHRLAGSAVALLLVSCAYTSVPEPAALRPSGSLTQTVCNHQFDARQLELGAEFIETEASSIIDGETAGELLKSMNSALPYRGAGNTRWAIKWSYGSVRNAIECSIKDPKVKVEVNYHLPYWPEQINATNRTLVSQWSDYSDALIAHHCRHGKAGIDAALEVKENLQSLVVSGSCDQLKANADAIARNVINKYKDAESRFIPPDIADFVKR